MGLSLLALALTTSNAAEGIPATSHTATTTVRVQAPYAGAATTVYSEIPGNRGLIVNVLGASVARDFLNRWTAEFAAEIWYATAGARTAWALRGGPFLTLADRRGTDGRGAVLHLVALGHATIRSRTWRFPDDPKGQQSLAAGVAPALNLTYFTNPHRGWNVRLRPLVAVALWRSSDSPTFSGYDGYGSYSDGYRVQLGAYVDLGVVF